MKLDFTCWCSLGVIVTMCRNRRCVVIVTMSRNCYHVS